MIVGVPREIKDNENRIAIVPAGVAEGIAAHATGSTRTATDLNTGVRERGSSRRGTRTFASG